jgi:hypothetical protein
VRAYINTGCSLEWLCEFSPVVVHAQVQSVTAHEQDPASRFESARLACKPGEALKGRAGEVIHFKFEGYGPAGEKGTSYLLFLDRDDEGRLRVTYWINLDQPCTELSRGVAYTKTGEVLTRGARILECARERLQGKVRQSRPSDRVRGLPDTLYIEAPGASAQALYAGSTTYLLVPPDPEFKEVFLERYRQAAKGRKRVADDLSAAKALLALSYFPDEGLIRLLREALTDGSRWRFRLRAEPAIGFAGETVELYVLRQAAYEALTAAGRAVAMPEGFCKYFHLDVRGAASGYSWGFRDPKTGRVIPFDGVD